MQFFKSAITALLIAATVSCQIALADKGFTGMKLNENIIVEYVMPNSPAQKAGILRGDKIESVNNVPSAGKKLEQVVNLITGPSGTKLSLVIVRGANRYKCDLVRGVSEAAIEAAAEQDDIKHGGIYTGLSVSSNYRIESVDESSPAWYAGLRPGDQIEYLNGTNVQNHPGNKDMLDMLVNPSGGALNLRVTRGTRRFDVSFGGGRKPQGTPRKYTTSSPTIPVATSSPANTNRVQPQRTSSNTAQPPATSINQPKIEIVVPVEIFRRTQYTDKTEQQVRAAISKVPKRVQESVKSAGITIFIVPDMLSAHPELNIEKPRGYHGGGYDNCGGMFSSGPKKIYICERVSWRNSPLQENWHLPATSLHEMGHAYDHTGSYSKAEEFVKAYEDDGKYLGSEQRRTWEYFLQENDAGRSEMFAELFVASISPSDDKRAAGLSQAFPRCTKYVQGLLGK